MAATGVAGNRREVGSRVGGDKGRRSTGKLAAGLAATRGRRATRKLVSELATTRGGGQQGS